MSDENKKVPLMMGEGPDRVEIGEAEVEILADGSMAVKTTVSDPDLAKKLGFSDTDAKWAIPAFYGEDYI